MTFILDEEPPREAGPLGKFGQTDAHSPPSLYRLESSRNPDFVATSLRDKLRVSFRGLKLGARGHSRIFAHFFCIVVVVAGGCVLRCEPLEWGLLVGCIALVLTAEMFRSALEVLVLGLEQDTRDRVRPSLDVAAGAVFLACVCAAIMGSIVFLYRIFDLITWQNGF